MLRASQGAAAEEEHKPLPGVKAELNIPLYHPYLAIPVSYLPE